MSPYSGDCFCEAVDDRYGINSKNIIEVGDIIKPTTGAGSMKQGRSVTELGENISDISASSLTLKVSNENCGGSDLTAETMAEGSPRASSSWDYGYILKLDSTIDAGGNTSGLSDLVVGDSQVAQGCNYKSYVLSDTIKSEGLKKMMHEENLQIDRTRLSGMLMDSIYSPISSCSPKLEKDKEMGDWLELGLASGHHGSKGFQVTKHFETNTKPGSFMKTNTSIRKGHEKDNVFLISSCDHQPYVQTSGLSIRTSEPSFSTQYNTSGSYQVSQQAGQEIRRSDFLYPISGQSALLQDTIYRIQSQDYCNNGEFAWTKSTNIGEFIRPSVSEKVTNGRRLLPGGLTGRTQYQRRPQYTQPLSIYQSQQRETLVKLAGGMQPFSVTQNAMISKHRKREAGLWFILQVANTQNRDSFLPQIPKAYLRIKDGSMTILMVKKYLASKLGFHNESEIEISCKGQQLLPSVSLQHVRDVIWFSSLKLKQGSEVPAPSFSYQHVMILNYQRSLRHT